MREVDVTELDDDGSMRAELEHLRAENRQLREALVRGPQGVEERLRAYIRAIPDISLIVDEDGRYVEALGEPGLLAAPPAQVVGRRVQDLFAPSIAEEFLAVVRAAITTGVVQQKEYELEVPSGRRWFEGRAARLETTVDGRRAVLWVSWDITARKRAEAELERQIEVREMLFERLPVMLVTIDAAGALTHVNRTWEQVFGWSGAEAVGHPELLARLYPDAAVRQELLDFIRSGEPGWRAFRPTTKGGEVLDTLWANLRLSDGQTVGIGQDLTERKRLERQMWQAQKLESIGRLAGGVAHDFNNLLTAILGYAEILADEIPEGAAEEDLREITSAAERARELTKQLLAFARRQVIAPRVLDLSALIGGMDRLLRRLLGEAIELELDVQAELWPVLADPSQLEQVVMNLAINARDAMPNGGRLVIETRNVRPPATPGQPPPPGIVVLRVRDSGVGMAPELLEHVFEPFFTTKAAGEGTGLGLATVYGIVTQTGGQVAVESAVGRGTTFEITLPRTTLSVDLPEVTGPISRHAHSGTILVVEDEEQVRRLVVNALKSAGYDTLTASNGPEALRIADALRAPIHLLVTDVVMPGMSGRQLADALATRRPETPCLFVSGYSAEMVGHSLGAGRAFLAKPFTTSKLIAKIEELLDGGAG